MAGPEGSQPLPGCESGLAEVIWDAKAQEVPSAWGWTCTCWGLWNTGFEATGEGLPFTGRLLCIRHHASTISLNPEHSPLA